ncbi:alpha/beta fold hydrolase [Bacillus sp. 03113]|uniref:alpha/beta fold hydrolase n=1 Tax=Bacillus sp. 03113 TaxID=2578211 RepID=UPI00114258DF|nr:alpha/beta fold hydrolase [Bacillus sp. 03113]
MIIIEKIKINTIPALHIVEKNNFDKQLPFIIFIHGFTDTKEKYLNYAYLLAEKGYRVVLPETIYHGERKEGHSMLSLSFQFLNIVLTTIKELALIKSYFQEKKIIDETKIGIAGISMGGIITLGALSKYPWIKTAVSLMGMPYYEKFALWQIEEFRSKGIQIPLKADELSLLINQINQFDISKQAEKLMNRPLMFWHGKNDTVVPHSFAYHFYEDIKPMYRNDPDKLLFISDEKAGHKVSHEGVMETIHWFETHLV